ncbi:MAG: hypothetical protein IJZ62_03550 [Clostridia bacterium]|nr:hypothetical protein [Clostridia bacterium]
MDKKIELCGSELIALASSLAISIGKKFCKEDLRKLRFFFNSIASNIAIIESEGYERQKKDKLT